MTPTPPEVADETVFCSQCGAKNAAGAAFCSKCGAKLNVAASVR